MRFYHCIALTDVILFIVLLTEGILNGLANALSMLPVAMGFFILFIGIGAGQQANAIKWALWYYENRHVIRDYHKKFGTINSEEAMHHAESENQHRN